MSTGFAAIDARRDQAGDVVAIFAQGPVGLCATAGPAHSAPGTIIAVESIPERVAMAKRLGADIVIEPTDAVATIMELTATKASTSPSKHSATRSRSRTPAVSSAWAAPSALSASMVPFRS